MAYIYVIFVFLMLTIFVTIVLGLFQSNLRQAKNQEKNVQAYYLSLSGVDIATAALLQPGARGDNDTLLYKRFSTANMPTLNTSYSLSDSLELTDGSVEIEIKAFQKDGERWIKIKSIGTLTGSDISKTVTMSFPLSNPDNRVWNQE